MANEIDISIKKQCVEMAAAGQTVTEIYKSYFSKVHQGMSKVTFKNKLREWKKKTFPNDQTLEAGTYNGFIAHNATVQVNANGEITQAWIKQARGDEWYEEILETIKENASPVWIEPKEINGDGMLEISLFDMHFPLSDHKETLAELLGIIKGKEWDEINIAIGQDLFHNDDFRGRTSSGREIEKVNMPQAWNTAKLFWFNVCKAAEEQSKKVNLIYSKGNHDESMGWAFIQLLKQAFPAINVDDSLKQRKCISWKECFIGITHGVKSNADQLRGQFTIEFPQEFAAAKVREIHTGHLHHEKEADCFGVMVRRLSTATPTDEWSDDNGFVGAHKRFMIFEWATGRLKAINYI